MQSQLHIDKNPSNFHDCLIVSPYFVFFFALFRPISLQYVHTYILHRDEQQTAFNVADKLWIVAALIAAALKFSQVAGGALGGALEANKASVCVHCLCVSGNLTGGGGGGGSGARWGERLSYRACPPTRTAVSHPMTSFFWYLSACVPPYLPPSLPSYLSVRWDKF